MRLRFKKWMTEGVTPPPARVTFGRLVREVHRKDLAKIGSRVNKFTKHEIRDEPFNDIFGDKFRIIVPILEKTERDFLAFLMSHGVYDFNLSKGTGVVNVTTDRGAKKREVRIGGLLQQLKANKWLDFWQKNKSSLAAPDREGVSIIVSRHPIDIVRMSDHSEWSSCHSTGNSYFKCALEEARTGGGIAYVVRTRDLAKVKNLQAKDIFEDSERDVPGIEPLERLRLRRFSDGANDYLVPELRTYGIKNVDFYETLKQWALTAQENKLSNVDYDKLELRGGSYQDTPAYAMWSNFLGKEFSGNKRSIDQEDGDKVEQLEDLVQGAIAGHTFEHFDVHADVEVADGEPYISYRAYVSYNFPLSELTKSLADKDRRSLQKEIEESLDVYSIDQVEISDDDLNSLYVNVDIRDEEDNNTVEQLEHFLDYVDGVDAEYQGQYNTVRHILWQKGYLNNPADMPLKHFKFEYDYKPGGRPPVYYYESPPETVGHIGGIPQELVGIQAVGSLHDKTAEYGAVEKSLNTTIRHIATSLADLGEVNEFGARVFVGKEHIPENEYLSDEPLRTHENIPLYFSINFRIENTGDKTLEAVRRIDEIYPKILAAAKAWWEQQRAKYMLGSPTGNPGDHPATRAALERLNYYFKSRDQNGNLFVKNVGGKLQYWYEDAEGGINMPAASAVQMLLRDQQAGAQWRKRLSLDLLRRGELIIKYKGGKPEYYWHDRGDNITLPIQEAIRRYEAEYRQRWGRPR